MSSVTASRSVPVERILYYDLPGILPTGNILVVNRTLDTVLILAIKDGCPTLEHEQSFAPGEMCLLVPLLKVYPEYCPIEVLVASIGGDTGVTERDITRARRRLHDALEEGRWSGETAPVRNLLSRVRLKTKLMGLDMVSILETGYMLRRAK